MSLNKAEQIDARNMCLQMAIEATREPGHHSTVLAAAKAFFEYIYPDEKEASFDKPGPHPGFKPENVYDPVTIPSGRLFTGTGFQGYGKLGLTNINLADQLIVRRHRDLVSEIKAVTEAMMERGIYVVK